MAVTRDGGFEVVSGEWREAVSDEIANCMIQNTEQSALYLALSATQPAEEFKGAHKVFPGKVWVRSDAESTPIQQGKIWLRGDKKMLVAITDGE